MRRRTMSPWLDQRAPAVRAPASARHESPRSWPSSSVGLAGGLIGYTLVKLQCHGTCATQRGLGALFGAIVAALGMSVVAVLVLRAVGEWKELERRREAPTRIS